MKTWVSEAAFATAALAFVEPIVSKLTTFGIPDPWDKLALGLGAVLTFVLRQAAKKAQA